MNDSTALKDFHALDARLKQIVLGQDHVVEALLISLLTNGNLLLEGFPGTAKTRSVKALAQALSASFGRIQFTPDLLPSDVTGTEIYQEVEGGHRLTFQPGPIFNNLILADEINRAPAKVQSALLEAMEERQITVGGKTYPLPELFMVLATQNPIEQEGTYPLPEAQMDRFLMKVSIDYPDAAGEAEILRLVRSEENANETGEPVADQACVFAGRAALKSIHVSEAIDNYIVGLVMATRQPEIYQSDLKDWIEIGASPRASIALDKCARARAWLRGRDYVDPDDVRSVMPAVLGHRFIMSYEAMAQGISSKRVVEEILTQVAVG